MKKRFYLAYGSNLNISQMNRRCPGARAVGTTVIKGYELLFKGSKTGAYLTIEKKEGAKVHAAVWATTAEDEASLDRYEGCPEFYYKTEMDVRVKEISSDRERDIRAYVYIMHEDREIGQPSEAYIDTCLQGYWDFDLPSLCLRKAVVANEKYMRKHAGKPMPRICPACGETYYDVPAISRKQGHADICPDCGTREALEAMGLGPVEQGRILRLIYCHMERK